MTKQDDPMRRAFAAYFKYSESLDQPSQSISTIETHAGKDYVVLRNVNGVLAVYRIQQSGRLKGLKRWPMQIEIPAEVRAEHERKINAVLTSDALKAHSDRERAKMDALMH